MTIYLWSIAYILVSLFVHELGHLIVARWCGAGVTQISLGIGPELVGHIDRFGTRWTVAVLPIGGWTKFVDGNVNGEKIVPGRTRRHFSEISKMGRAAIYLAGPVSNFLFAAAIAGCLVVVYGEKSFSLSDFELARSMALMATIFSVGLGLFNLLPVFPLDGWLLVRLLFERGSKKPLLILSDNIANQSRPHNLIQ